MIPRIENLNLDRNDMKDLADSAVITIKIGDVRSLVKRLGMDVKDYKLTGMDKIALLEVDKKLADESNSEMKKNSDELVKENARLVKKVNAFCEGLKERDWSAYESMKCNYEMLDCGYQEALKELERINSITVEDILEYVESPYIHGREQAQAIKNLIDGK
jgi:hypothetical protein